MSTSSSSRTENTGQAAGQHEQENRRRTSRSPSFEINQSSIVERCSVLYTTLGGKYPYCNRTQVDRSF
ncbi:uncharacterized protein MAM_06398 [Metarhizium album ARSEF 1941]|uniref:Uncharacterized protein n=1 Tax=Metarhizium album (strain ARSEF 1941) TaxID=1081103 RepID=A0A0B2WID8_METAS|nr:uncharacterized protein MAM_06398 [Metarhizium album ARSEF 1941]KHN95786.1 hypothetical protein MAM_06398 [Metarhizium album ARSEF 1941]